MQTQANTQAIHDGAHAAGAAAHAATLAAGGSQDDATRAFDEAAAAYVAARPVPPGHRAITPADSYRRAWMFAPAHTCHACGNEYRTEEALEDHPCEADDCSICVPGQCPGPNECPGNEGTTWDES